ncbi:FecR family protein [Allorhizobium undicola]|uniref:FecR family protein n=1 Tax=Allorhizobium undicola TaxID=78527 RepID=UPI003D345B60
MDRALEWFVRLQAEEGNDSGLNARFLSWLRQDERHEAAWQAVTNVWNDDVIVAASRQLDEANTAATGHEPRRLSLGWNAAVLPVASLPRFATGIMRQSRLLSPVAVLSALAVALLIFIIAPALVSTLTLRWQADFRSNIGKTEAITLPDGSRMQLDTNSAVAMDFAGGRRSLRVLQGGIWLDVKHDPAHPFRVRGRYSEVTVKGTAFAVAVTEDQDKILLQRGLIEARHSPGDGAVVLLQPGEMLTASPEALSPVGRFDEAEALAWVSGRIVLKSRPLREALHAITPYFDGSVFVSNREILDHAVSGNFRTDNAAAAIAGVVAAAGGTVTHLPGDFLIIR